MGNVKDPNRKVMIHTPFRSEAICAGLLERGYSIENITTTQKGAFKKSYSDDIEAVFIEEDGQESFFDVVINRDSIYDLLPEGLFHQTRGSRTIRTVQDAVGEHKKYKEEERLARKFFAPVEQMIFRYKIYTELAEREALYDIQNGKLNESFYSFWNIDKDLPEPYANRLIQLLPQAYFIKGNADATCAALEYILEKEILVERKYSQKNNALAEPMALRQSSLGMNAVLGANTKDIDNTWVFKIGGISVAEMHKFVQDAPLGRLLQKFTEIFIPLEVDAVYEYETKPSSNEADYDAILGYGCCI